MNNTPSLEAKTETSLQKNTPYRVLARKYRPSNFDDLIGQEPMVRTLRNAFEYDRIAQAYMLTGVRGVGKTTTARILARGLNYSLPGGADKPSIHLEKEGEHCKAIMEGRHVDVLEMDAASHNGVDDIREITDASRYRPVSARYKVYILDEVHMLSTAAFNALLKTLEEPPSHVKFIFATTEIRKVPVTILSRCQRFDLRRIEPETMIRHLAGIAEKESVTVEDEALVMLARAAEGSVRDALSLLDQAIAHGHGHVSAAILRDMLGLADRTRILDLFEAVMQGKTQDALQILSDHYNAGADPAVVLTDLSDICHLATRIKIAPDTANSKTLSQEERNRGKAFAENIPMSVLSRAWQILLKGIEETRAAPKPIQAADMVLVRLAHMSGLPTPEEAMRLLEKASITEAGSATPVKPSGSGARMHRVVQGGASPAQASPARQNEAISAPQVTLSSLQDMVALAEKHKDMVMKVAIERNIRLSRLEQGRLEVGLTEDASPTLIGDLTKRLHEWTGQRWVITVARDAAAETLHETASAERDRRLNDALEHPLVASLMKQFPGARVVDVRMETAENAKDNTDGIEISEIEDTDTD
jgi:DNA polymerase-3 subunit gamma/tau